MASSRIFVQHLGARARAGLLSLSAPRLGAPKFERKMLGSYPVAPEFEMVWRDRLTAHGGYIQQTISPYQLKFIYPFWHTFAARCWAKCSGYALPWIWPGLITFGLLKKMHHDVEEDIRDHYW
ncbi:hypothetical protein BESB_059040 [Besnoitia besnoiti]|uniref:Uncharacterized protein n=1 Tax=Besnoitia besnoiti TaxID=94643 RepID=A0A2A9MHE8_BESBE|nr:hypothetical protein BESB_059040 [Besnoitia besnoiti]PFH35017.1 hypothetical protein BESB_059040 [Besnoitia besnoiti]